MAKRPSFQFYPADWRNNAKLRRCSEAARGAWIDVLCLLHDSDEYGVLRWPLADIARATGLPLKLLKELADRDVLKGGDKGCEAYIHIPTHARKQGAPITLLEKTSSPCWYSSRFLTDEWKRSVSGGNTKFQSPNSSPSHGKVNGEVQENQSPNSSPSHGKVNGEVQENQSPISSPSTRLGAGATSPSTSTTTNLEGGDNSQSSAPPAGSQTAPPVNPNSESKTTAGEVCKQLMSLQIGAVNPGHPLLTMLLEAGATMEEFTGAAKSAVANGKGKFAYVLNTVKGQREDAKAAASTIAVGSIKREKPWFITASGIEAKAKELNITINPKDEAFPQLRVKVFRACGITQEIVRKANQDFGAKS